MWLQSEWFLTLLVDLAILNLVLLVGEGAEDAAEEVAATTATLLVVALVVALVAALLVVAAAVVVWREEILVQLISFRFFWGLHCYKQFPC